jgi:hypothetical protein
MDEHIFINISQEVLTPGFKPVQIKIKFESPNITHRNWWANSHYSEFFSRVHTWEVFTTKNILLMSTSGGDILFFKNQNCVHIIFSRNTTKKAQKTIYVTHLYSH